MLRFVALGSLVTLVACGDDAATAGDARPPCAETAEPHDEDGDGIFDACDNCPAVANAMQSDTTEREARSFPDGVGDACDLRPSVGGDALRAFYSFASEDQADGWTGSGFSIAGDAAHASGTATWASARAAPGGGVIVIAHIAALSFAAQGQLSIAFDGDGITSGAACTLSAQTLTASEPAGESMSSDLASAIEPDESLMLVAWRTSAFSSSGIRVGLLECRVMRGAITTQASLMLSDELVSGMHVIATRDAALSMTSASVYTSPPPKNP